MFSRSTIILCGLLLVTLVGVLGYREYRHQSTIELLLNERQFFMGEYGSSSAALQRERELASSTSATLAITMADLHAAEEALEREKDRNDDFEDELRELAGTVGMLDKLAKTDEELLQKYSKVYFLNENYIPTRLTQIPESYILPGKKDQYFHASAYKYLKRLLDAAEDDGIDLKVVSAYRSFDEQNELKGSYTQQYGSGANTFSADQGYSEHQLGTTIDFTDATTGGAFASFANTEAYQWLIKNAHEYGFVLSYPQGNAYYIFEPWHWRFVGRKLAGDLKKDNANFYDWDQRKIDEYLVNTFD